MSEFYNPPARAKAKGGGFFTPRLIKKILTGMLETNRVFKIPEFPSGTIL